MTAESDGRVWGIENLEFGGTNSDEHMFSFPPAVIRRTGHCGVRFLSKQVFDRSLKRRQREFTLNRLEDARYYDYLREESARRLVDRLEDITKSFPLAVELGSYRGAVYELIAQSKLETLSGENPHSKGCIGGIETLVQCDMSALHSLDEAAQEQRRVLSQALPFQRVLCDDEFLPFADESVDLVLSNMSLHWVNDIPQTLQRVLSVLRPDGAFVCNMLGGNTLSELRHCFYLAEQERRGGMSPHASPLALPSDVAGLMQAANFALPTVDIDTIEISYPDVFTLMEHIFKMGEGTAALNRQYSVGRDTFLAMAAIYQNLYGVEEDGSVKATFELISMIGWKAHESQQKPCKRGSAQTSMKDLKKATPSQSTTN